MLSLSRTAFKKLYTQSRANYSEKLGPMQKIIMLCGAPGVGKGMYSTMLAKDFGYVKISTGDEIRKVLNGTKATTLTPKVLTQVRKSMSQGKLIPDEIIMEIIYNKIKEPASARGVILDGFPRTVAQLNMFTQVLPIHLVVNIEHSYEYLMASILGRRTCMDCGTSYSAYSFYKNGYELDVQMPQKEGVCDCCGGHVTTRPDDKEDIVKARLKEYENKTYPLLKEMKHEGLLIPFKAKRGERDYPKLQQIIVSKIGLPNYYFHQSYHREQNLAVAYD